MQVIQRDTGIILRNGESPEILLFHDNQLPSVSPAQHFWQSCVPVNTSFLNDYSLKLITIRPLKSDFIQISDESGEIQNVYMMRYLHGHLPDNARWIPLDEMPALDTTMSITKKEILLAWQSKTMPDWYHYDWYDKFMIAIESITDDAPEQIRSWERSTIWRIPTKEGNSYFKATPKMFAHEIPLTNWLSQQFPQKSPQMLSSPRPDTMRTADYGQIDLMSSKDLDSWLDAIQIYAELQLETIPHNQTLLEMNVPVRGMNWIAERMEVFLGEDDNLTQGERPLNEDEIAKLRSAIPQLKESINALKDCPIPETLEHGDLWAGQVIVHDGRIIITDWSDSAISFPFFSLVFFLTDIESILADYPDAKTIFEDAYLGQWLDFGELSTLREILASANLITNLYMALTYHYGILPDMGQKWEMHNMIAYHMRQLLAKL